jgi:hypothetical protein
MKTSVQTFFLAIVLCICYAFTGAVNPTVLGVYGVSDSDPSQIELSLMEDGKFTYQDLSSALHPIRTKGVWVQKGNTIKLSSSDNGLKFHCIWHLKESGKVAVSRKGMCFYRLIKR